MLLRLLAPTLFEGEYAHRSLRDPGDLTQLCHGPKEGAGVFEEWEVEARMIKNSNLLEPEEVPEGHREDTPADLARRTEEDAARFPDVADLLERGSFLSAEDYAIRVKTLAGL